MTRVNAVLHTDAHSRSRVYSVPVESLFSNTRRRRRRRRRSRSRKFNVGRVLVHNTPQRRRSREGERGIKRLWSA
jgi:hypothetical protein